MLNCGCSSGGSTGQLRLVIQSLAALVCRSGILTPVRLTESSAGEWGMHNSIISELVHTPAQAPDVFVLIPASSFLTLSSYLGVTHFFCILFKEAQLEALVQLQFPDMPHLMEMLPGGMQLIQQTGHLSGKAQCVTWQQQAHRVCLTFSTSLLIWMWWQVFFGLNQQFITSVFYTAVLLLCLVLQVHKWGTKQHLHVYNSTV